MALETWLTQSLAAHSWIVLALAFAGGVVSSLLPCTIAMVPILIGYIGGYSGQSKWQTVAQVFWFIMGLALIMTILGVTASWLGVAFGSLIGGTWYYLIGGLAILMALQLLEIIHLPLPQFVTKLPESKSGRILAPLTLGLAFGTAASPCGTPFLAAILGFISREHNIGLGGSSLFCYALGQGMLFAVVGVFTGLLKHLAILRHVGLVMTRLSAGVFIIVGLMLIAMGAGVLVPVLTALHLF